MFNICAAVGLMFILKYSTILDNFRDRLINKDFGYKTPGRDEEVKSFFKDLFSCSLCLGFWSGIIVGIVTLSNPITLALASAGACWIADNFNNVLQSIETKLDG